MSVIFLVSTKGELNRRAKLSEKQVDHIRKCKSNGVRSDELAALFGVTVASINAANRGARWGSTKK